jgi:hypothetical protein
MRIKRIFPLLLTVALVVAAVTLAVQLRKHAPPEPARLLPGADAFLYVNLKWGRLVNASGPLPAVSHDPEYERFIQATGFQFERDLEEAAFAIHYPANWPGGGTGGGAREPRFSEVLIGKFEGERLAAYLKQVASSVENYHSVDIFTVPIEGRAFRAAILSVDSIAASNHDDPDVIRGIVDRSRRLASPFGGPALLRQYYKRVPIASLAWLVARVEPSAAASLGGWAMIFPKPAAVVISARYLRALHLRGEAFTASADDARNIADKLDAYLAAFHTAEATAGIHPDDTDMRAFLDSLKVQQEGDRTVLSATMPAGIFRKMLEATPTEMSSPAVQAPVPQSH